MNGLPGNLDKQPVKHKRYLYTTLTLTGTLSGDRFLFRLNQFPETLSLVIEASDNSSPVSLDKNDLFYPCI